MISGPNKKLDPANFAQSVNDIRYVMPQNSQDALAVTFKMNKNYLCKYIDSEAGFHYLHKYHITADDGSSGMQPHEDVLKRIQALGDPDSEIYNHLIDYGSHCFNDEYAAHLSDYVKAIGLVNQKTKIFAHPYDESIAYPQDALFPALGHGTSQLFSGVISTLNTQADDVILEFTPSYGLFNNILSKKNITVETVNVFDPVKGTVDIHALKNKIHKVQGELLAKYFAELIVQSKMLAQLDELGASKADIQAYQSMIEAMMREKITPERIASFNAGLQLLLDKLCAQIDTNIEYTDAKKNMLKSCIGVLGNKIKLRPMPAIKAIYSINPLMPYGAILNQEQINAIATVLKESCPGALVIDDLSYYNLVMPDASVKPGSFCSSSMQNHTVSLLGFSKDWSLAGLRVGLALGSAEVIKPILNYINDEITMPSIFAKEAADTIFSLSTKERIEHLAFGNNEYFQRRDLAMALTLGLHNLENQSNKDYIIAALKKERLPQMMIDQLLAGVNGLGIICKPQSGYFLCLDVSQFIGCKIRDHTLNTAQDIRTAIYCYTDINTISSEMCLSFDKQFLRFSYNMEPKNIIEAFIRLHQFLHALAPAVVPALITSKKAKNQIASAAVLVDKKVDSESKSKRQIVKANSTADGEEEIHASPSAPQYIDMVQELDRQTKELKRKEKLKDQPVNSKRQVKERKESKLENPLPLQAQPQDKPIDKASKKRKDFEQEHVGAQALAKRPTLEQMYKNINKKANPDFGRGMRNRDKSKRLV